MSKKLTKQQLDDLEWAERHRRLYESASRWLGGLLLLAINIGWSWQINISVLQTFTASTPALLGFFFELGVLVPLCILDFYIASRTKTDAAVAVMMAVMMAALVAALVAEAVATAIVAVMVAALVAVAVALVAVMAAALAAILLFDD